MTKNSTTNTDKFPPSFLPFEIFNFYTNHSLPKQILINFIRKKHIMPSLSHDNKQDTILSTLMDCVTIPAKTSQKLIDVNKTPRFTQKPTWSDMLAWVNAYKNCARAHTSSSAQLNMENRHVETNVACFTASRHLSDNAISPTLRSSACIAD
jgi:hypothetical protein